MEQIVRILTSIRPEFDFKKYEDFIEDGVLDSLDIILLVTELDDLYDISIEGTDIIPENFQNLITIRNMLERYGVQL